MKEIRVISLAEYVKEISTILEDFNIMKIMFRGQRRDEKLLPKIVRDTHLKKSEILEIEKYMLKDFKRKARLYLDFEPNNDLEWLAIAQHHGLKTRLLDWTENALAALWFCVEQKPENMKGYGVVWVSEFLDIESYYVNDDDYINPFKIERTKIFKPVHLTKRIISQSGIFKVHKILYKEKIAIPLEKNPHFTETLTKIKIPYQKFENIKFNLERCGITSASLFPDLDGLCKSFNDKLEPIENRRRFDDIFNIKNGEKLPYRRKKD